MTRSAVHLLIQPNGTTHMIKRNLLASCLLLGGLLSGAQALAAGLVIGEPAPDFTLQDSDGKTRSLTEFKGKTVVLEWSSPICPFVKKHYESGNLPKQQQEATQQGVVWLTINSTATGREGLFNGEEANQWRKEQHAAQTAYLIDPDSKVAFAYGAKTTPHLFVIDGEGKLRYNGAIDSVPSTKVEDLKRAQQYVPAVLAKLAKGEAVEKPITAPYGCSVKYPVVNPDEEEDCGC